ncbi:hypothetical protein R3P38DRAFT_2612384 [Favolaschia claudopus]|uniref:PH domain-containing protein n=1 Tax=Favolaschia claudopus TaxID=2862362 RepID=A0AAW0CPN2_9AGAR
MTKTLELFRGDCTAEKAQVWLRTLEGSFTESTKEETKLYKFERALYPGGAAEKWWTDLQAGDKSDFKKVVKAFDAKWPMPQYVARPQALVINEIKANKLRLEDVGQVVKDEDGLEVLALQAWVQRTRKLLADIPNGDVGMLLMEHVRDGLPIGVRKLIPTGQTLDTWEKWLVAVEAIDLHAINDLREEHRLGPAAGPLAHVLGTTHLLSPVRTPPVRNTPQYTPHVARLSQPEFIPTRQPTPPKYPPFTPSTPQRGPPPHMMGSSTLGGSATMRPGNLFARYPFPAPSSPSAGRGGPASLGGDPTRDAELARTLNTNPRLYAADAAGKQRYEADMTSWMANARDYAAFPFSPGTVAPGSKECWSCGVLTAPPHGAGSCTASTRIPRVEYNVRRFVGQILHPPGQRAGIMQINDTPYDPFGGYDPEQAIFEDEESGNGEELTY